LVAATVGCGASDEASRATTASDDTQSSSTTPEVRENIRAAQQALVDQLLTRLMDAMSEGGVSSAITVCKTDAPAIAKSVGEQFGVRIGRTSFRLRNPENAPPEWAKPLIEQRVEEPQFVDLDGGAVAALLPIRLQPQCMVCHGPADQLGEDVKQSLADHYPEDEAVDFHAGDLRGWFWIESPAEG
jgi:hypothetical protein